MKDPVVLHIRGIRCDAPGCGWKDMSADISKDLASWLDRKCPQCGAPLLTVEDYAAVQAAIAAAALINMESGPIPDDKETVFMPIEMDGTGKLEFKEPRS